MAQNSPLQRGDVSQHSIG